MGVKGRRGGPASVSQSIWPPHAGLTRDSLTGRDRGLVPRRGGGGEVVVKTREHSVTAVSQLLLVIL